MYTGMSSRESWHSVVSQHSLNESLTPGCGLHAGDFSESFGEVALIGEAAMYRFDIPPNGQVGPSTVLLPDTWYDINLEWSGTEGNVAHGCRVSINGTRLPGVLPLKNVSRNGICYVRFRSTVPDEDLAGRLVESIKADVATAH